MFQLGESEEVKCHTLNQVRGRGWQLAVWLQFSLVFFPFNSVNYFI